MSVPATTANLGVGFDVLGLALDLSARFSFEVSDELSFTGCAEHHVGEHNLVWRSYCTACEAFGVTTHTLHVHEDSPIPESGGLGSSSACVVAGIAAAQALAGQRIDRARTLDLATRIEGHPDNVAPAVMGGLVSSFVEEDRTITTRWPVAPSLRLACMAPPYRVLTRDARQALPTMVPTSSVSWQVGRCLAMVSALATGDGTTIAESCHDRIHEPYRAPLIPDYELLRDRSLAAGASAFLISGSGAAMIAICDGDDTVKRVLEAGRDAVPELWTKAMLASERGVTIVTESIESEE